jgi:DNA (cytosine-5)-methyltransferase 1
MRLLDLFCGAGGAAMGYHRAGFEVVGVDTKPQPNYPFEFYQANALDFPLDGFDMIHASPPCQAYSCMKALWPEKKYDDLVGYIREKLTESGLPYIIENVPGAPLIAPIKLCGSMFDLGAGPYALRRHRMFECSFHVNQPKCSHTKGKPVIGVYGDHVRCSRRNGDLPMALGKPLADEAMGIDWMNWRELTQSIPPAYTEFLGRHALAFLGKEGK